MSDDYKPGWYRTRHGVLNWMLYARDEFGNWSAHDLNGDATPCDFSYIDQAGELELVAAFPRGAE